MENQDYFDTNTTKIRLQNVKSVVKTKNGLIENLWKDNESIKVNRAQNLLQLFFKVYYSHSRILSFILIWCFQLQIKPIF